MVAFGVMALWIGVGVVVAIAFLRGAREPEDPIVMMAKRDTRKQREREREKQAAEREPTPPPFC